VEEVHFLLICLRLRRNCFIQLSACSLALRQSSFIMSSRLNSRSTTPLIKEEEEEAEEAHACRMSRCVPEPRPYN
jgi:hypothetical protein